MTFGPMHITCPQNRRRARGQFAKSSLSTNTCSWRARITQRTKVRGQVRTLQKAFSHGSNTSCAKKYSGTGIHPHRRRSSRLAHEEVGRNSAAFDQGCLHLTPGAFRPHYRAHVCHTGESGKRECGADLSVSGGTSWAGFRWSGVPEASLLKGLEIRGCDRPPHGLPTSRPSSGSPCSPIGAKALDGPTSEVEP